MNTNIRQSRIFSMALVLAFLSMLIFGVFSTVYNKAQATNLQVEQGQITKSSVPKPPKDKPKTDDGSSMDDSSMDDSAVDDGAVDDGAVDDGAVDDGMMDDGAVDDGAAQKCTHRTRPKTSGYVILETSRENDSARSHTTVSKQC